MGRWGMGISWVCVKHLGLIPGQLEYMVVSMDDAEKTAKLSLRQGEILDKLSHIVSDLCEGCPNEWGELDYVLAIYWQSDSVAIPTFHPEYGRYMLESTPGKPYTGCLPDLVAVEANMRYRCEYMHIWASTLGSNLYLRRNLARKYLKSCEIPLTFTSFPRLGVPGPFTEPYYDPIDAKSSHSLFLPEEIANKHVRFP